MSLRGVLQIALGIAVWAGVIVAAVFGAWLPLIGLLAAVGVLGAIVFGPSLIEARKRKRERG